MAIILIDSGTTNSRIRLVDEEEVKVTSVIKLEVGVRNTAIDKNNSKLKRELTQGIQELLKKNDLLPEQISYIAASGMITSNLGIHEVPHVTAPARLKDFIQHAELVKDKSFSNIPCIYIPGMKNNPPAVGGNPLHAEIDGYDVMRGEEVEAYGLLNQLSPSGKGIIVLPGSHTKFILADQDRSLLSCLSTLTGEMLKSISSQTILSSSLHERLIEEVDSASLIEGYQAAQQAGIARSFYHIRLLDLFDKADANQRANYFAGTVLYYDIQALTTMMEKERDLKWIMVGGTNPLRSAFVDILKHAMEDYPIIEADDEQVELAAVHGSYEIGRAYWKHHN